jgi:uncharacterized protein (TIGR04255 family)
MSDLPAAAGSRIEPITTEEPLTHAPVALVVCQIQYETNLTVSEGKTAQAIQGLLGGRERYLKLEQIAAQNVAVAVAPGAPPAISSSAALSGWRFTSADDCWSVTLLPDSASLQTNTYKSWSAGFGERLHDLVLALSEHVQPVFEQRLGLRYINRIVRDDVREPADWERYIIEDLVGPLKHPLFGPATKVALQQLTLSLSPAENIACNLRHGMVEDTTAPGGRSYLLDLDVYRQAGLVFDPEMTAAAAYLLRGYAVRLFHAALQPTFLSELV